MNSGQGTARQTILVKGRRSGCRYGFAQMPFKVFLLNKSGIIDLSVWSIAGNHPGILMQKTICTIVVAVSALRLQSPANNVRVPVFAAVTSMLLDFYRQKNDCRRERFALPGKRNTDSQITGLARILFFAELRLQLGNLFLLFFQQLLPANRVQSEFLYFQHLYFEHF